ncbi:type II secretion system F family protein [Mycoplasmatota bacterium]|nr:type II secretion system F family protein [Mycoplasmatota bacterium]
MNCEKQYLLIRILNRLLTKGYSLLEAIEMMKNIDTKITRQMKEMLETGNLLSTVFKRLKFKRFVYETIQVGERSNKLNEVITLIEGHFDFYLKFKKQINKVLLYPLILFIFALICFEMIRINLYPVIKTLLGDYAIGQNDLLIFLSFNLLKCIALFLFVISLICKFYNSLSNLLPLMKIYRSLTLSKHLEVLLMCGNSLEEALIILKNSFNPITYRLDTFELSLLDDKKVGSFCPYPLAFIQYFKLGMKSNDIIGALQDYVYIYDEILFDKLTKITYYVQFSLFSLLSINIFLIYYIVMIPMLQISNKI